MSDNVVVLTFYMIMFIIKVKGQREGATNMDFNEYARKVGIKMSRWSMKISLRGACNNSVQSF
jgi:hypothetical protein